MATTRENLKASYGHGNPIGQKVTISWTSDASGDYTETVNLYGFIVKVNFNPSDGPTDNYDVTLIDEDGIDVLGGAGADRDTSTSECIPTPNTGVAVVGFAYGEVTFTIANAGNAKSGTTTIYVLNP